jgi:hypothetical protein
MLLRLSLVGFVVFAGICLAQTSPTPLPTNETGIEGVITITPTHGGPIRVGEESSRPLANMSFVVTNDKGSVGEFATNEQGRFKVSLLPGHYRVSRKGSQKGVGRYGPFDVDVSAGQMTKVEWRCDSGMR